MKKLLLLTLVLCFAFGGMLQAQSVPRPADPQKELIVLKNGVIHVGNGEVIPSGEILIEKGKISQVGEHVLYPDHAKVIDLEGMHVYPGLIAPVSSIGLTEIESVRATRDDQEVGDITPHVRSIIGYNTDSRVTPTLRSNGILLAQVKPRGGLVSGTSSIVQLDAWNWEDAAYLIDDAVHMRWPRMNIWTAPWAPPVEEQKRRQKESLEQIEAKMKEARAYATARAAGKPIKTDLRWEALIPVLEKKRPLFIMASSEKEITAAVAFGLKEDLNIVLYGAAEADRCLNLLKRHNIPVILQKPLALPSHAEDDIDRMYRMPAVLQEAGILYCLSMNDFWNYRNLPFAAGNAAAWGLTQEQALSAITLNTARILGIADRTGSLESGKDANIVVSKGDILDMQGNDVVMAFIQGRSIDLGNKQKDLYEKFRKEPVE